MLIPNGRIWGLVWAGPPAKFRGTCAGPQQQSISRGELHRVLHAIFSGAKRGRLVVVLDQSTCLMG